MYCRLFKLRETLEYIIAVDAAKLVQDRQVIPASDRSAHEKVQKMVAVIKDPLFWNSLIQSAVCKLKRRLRI